MNSKNNVLKLAFILFICVLLSCSKESEEKKKKTFNKPHIVSVYELKRGNLKSLLSLTGTVTATQDVNISPKISGTISKILVKEGIELKKDEGLLKLNDEDARIGVELAEANLNARDADLRQAKIDFKRMGELWKEKSIPKAKYDSALTLYDVAKASKKLAEVNLKKAKKFLSDTEIRAPFDCVVARKFVDVGDFVGPQRPVINIVDLKEVYVEVDIPEEYLSKFEKKNAESITKLDAYPKKEFKSRDILVQPLVDRISRTFKAKIFIKNIRQNKDYLLKGGMFARVSIIIEKKENIFIVPEEAIIEREKKSIIFIAKDGIANRLEVATGISYKGMVEIKAKALKVGQKVIVGGAYGLEHASKIEIKH